MSEELGHPGLQRCSAEPAEHRQHHVRRVHLQEVRQNDRRGRSLHGRVGRRLVVSAVVKRRAAWDVDKFFFHEVSFRPEHAVRRHPSRALLGFEVAEVRGALQRRHLARGDEAQHALDVLVGAGPLQVDRVEDAQQVALAVPGVSRESAPAVDAPAVGGHVGIDDVAGLGGDTTGGLDLERRDDDRIAASVEHVVVVGVLEDLALAWVRAVVGLVVSGTRAGGAAQERLHRGGLELEAVADEVREGFAHQGLAAADQLEDGLQVLAEIRLGDVGGDALD